MSVSTLRQNFLEKKQFLTHQIFNASEVSALADLEGALETFGHLQGLFQEAVIRKQQMDFSQKNFAQSISKVFKLSVADTVSFLIGISTLGVDYFQESSVPWLKEVALVGIIAAQVFSKMSDYSAFKTNQQRDVFALESQALHDVLKEELFVKIACKTLALSQERGFALEPLQVTWEKKREMFISSLQGRESDMVEINLAEDQTQHLLA